MSIFYVLFFLFFFPLFLKKQAKFHKTFLNTPIPLQSMSEDEHIQGKSAEELYLSCKQKYGLPNYDELNFEFEICTIEADEQFFLRNVIKKINERLNFFQNIFAEVLNPDMGSLSTFHESKFFDDLTKEKLFRTFHSIMLSQRKLLQAEVCLTDECCSKIIKEVWQDYFLLKKQTQNLAKELRETWEKEIDPKGELGYFG